MTKLIKRPKIDLSPFCGPNSKRYAIDEPWRNGGHVYATDGHILVRASIDCCRADEPTGKVPDNVDKFFEAVDKVRDWDMVPAINGCDQCHVATQVVDVRCRRRRYITLTQAREIALKILADAERNRAAERLEESRLNEMRWNDEDFS